MTAAGFWTDTAPVIVLALVLLWGLVLPAAVVVAVVKYARAESRARATALHELSDAISDTRPSDETLHAPAGQLIPLYTAPSFRHRRGGAA